jgi:alkanesulfonate monooxygenase SsuD/methylene tetrahydromethanopterin reductase-like flavin-dependent oxidoreductase (luciferase family)
VVATGVWLFSDAPAAALVEAIVMADEAGIDEVWVADEGVAREPLPVLAYAAARTSRIRLGVGITSPLLRHPGAIAASIATLDELSSGRAMLGLGIGGELSLAPFGIAYDAPVAILRNAVRVARAVLNGTPTDGYEPPPHAAPARHVPIHVGAKGEQLNRLASRDADGVFISGIDLEALDAPVAWARSVRAIHVGLYASVRFGPNPPADPTALAGPPAAVAAALAALVEPHQPATIGLALIDGDDPSAMVGLAIEALGAIAAST